MIKVKKFRLFIVASLTVVCLNGCVTSQRKPTSKTESITPKTTLETTTVKAQTTTATLKATNEYNVTLKLKSSAIAQNLLNETTEQNIYVYLPPSYYDNDKKYPVIYFLHGFGDSPQELLSANNKVQMDKSFKEGAQEFIFVGVSGTNKSGGSFYVNSPVIGNWEDYVIKEVVGLVDQKFRTLSSSASRGICGFSMGGFGAYNIALSHPDVFSAMLIMSPGLIADNELPIAMDSWKGDAIFKKAYAQAFSPNPSDTVNYGSIPRFSGTDADNKVVENWEDGFGNIAKKLDAYIALNKPLKAIKIVYGEADTYTWIPSGCKYFSKLLEDRNIEHSIEGLKGRHTMPSGVIQNYIIPFFNGALEY
jgi:S-formylglutathione hydrolase FrmB